MSLFHRWRNELLWSRRCHQQGNNGRQKVSHLTSQRISKLFCHNPRIIFKMELFLHQVFSQGIQAILYLFLVELVCRSWRKRPLGSLELLVKINLCSVIKISFENCLITYIKKLSSIFVAIINSNWSSANSNIKSHSEISWFERHLWAILLDDHLSLEEGSLWSSTINLLWLGNHDWSVF